MKSFKRMLWVVGVVSGTTLLGCKNEAPTTEPATKSSPAPTVNAAESAKTTNPVPPSEVLDGGETMVHAQLALGVDSQRALIAQAVKHANGDCKKMGTALSDSKVKEGLAMFNVITLSANSTTEQKEKAKAVRARLDKESDTSFAEALTAIDKCKSDSNVQAFLSSIAQVR